MIKYLLIISFTLGLLNLFAQKGKYTPVLTIKQPYHSYNATEFQDTKKAFQKVNGLKISDSQKYLIISYAQNPTHIAVYLVGTWERVGVYKVMGNGVEINNSYFADNDKVLYIKYDRFSTKYKMIEFKTGYIKKVNCSKTPKGCIYEEITQETKEVMTNNRKYQIEASKLDPSDVIVSVKK
ncbi:MAG: hypothetical protein IPO21_09410 [Bacteroidales bacterium]|nr:hypothetical protein [Bacteroidales bacterium]